MKKTLLVSMAWATLLVSVGAGAATLLRLDQVIAPRPGPGLVGFGTDRRLTSITVGANLDLTAGVLSAKPAASTSRSYAVTLTQDAQGNYPLPTGVQSKTVVYRNGLRQNPGGDYTIQANTVVPLASLPAWNSDGLDVVQVDGE